VKRPPRIAKLDGSAWTSEVEREGWRHFHVVGISRVDEQWLVELAASCDAARRVTVEARALLTSDGWRAGWTPLKSMG
jgi:tryptophan-rich hypothetical protein